MLHYKKMSELRAMARGHFFSRGAMRFFDSYVYNHVRTGITGWFFITSEQPPRSGSYRPDRGYTVRKMDTLGNVTTVGKFMGHATLEIALEVATEKAAEEKERWYEKHGC